MASLWIAYRRDMLRFRSSREREREGGREGERERERGGERERARERGRKKERERERDRERERQTERGWPICQVRLPRDASAFERRGHNFEKHKDRS